MCKCVRLLMGARRDITGSLELELQMVVRY